MDRWPRINALDHNKNAVVRERFIVMGNKASLDENWLILCGVIERMVAEGLYCAAGSAYEMGSVSRLTF